jgi:hypothetical protein
VPRVPSLEDVRDLAQGRPSSARAVGGNPHIGRLMVERALAETGATIVLLSLQELPDDAFVVPTAGMERPRLGSRSFRGAARPSSRCPRSRRTSAARRTRRCRSSAAQQLDAAVARRGANRAPGRRWRWDGARLPGAVDGDIQRLRRPGNADGDRRRVGESGDSRDPRRARRGVARPRCDDPHGGPR